MKIIKRIKRETDCKIPDLTDKIVGEVEWERIAEKTAAVSTAQRRKTRKKYFSIGMAFASIAIVFAILLPVVIRKPDSGVTTASAAYEVVISVNPAVKLTVDKNDKVVAQSALNADGVYFLYGCNYTGKRIDEATRAICADLKNLKFMTDGALIQITAFNKETHKTEESKQKDIMSAVMTYLDEASLGGVNTKFLNDDDLELIEEKYKTDKIAEYAKSQLQILKNRLIAEVNKKIQSIDELLKGLNACDLSGDTVNLDVTHFTQLKVFSAKYNFDLKIHAPFLVESETVKDLIEDLDECKEDLLESLEDIEDSDGDDFGESLSNLLEIMKEQLFNSDDD